MHPLFVSPLLFVTVAAVYEQVTLPITLGLRDVNMRHKKLSFLTCYVSEQAKPTFSMVASLYTFEGQLLVQTSLTSYKGTATLSVSPNDDMAESAMKVRQGYTAREKPVEDLFAVNFVYYENSSHFGVGSLSKVQASIPSKFSVEEVKRITLTAQGQHMVKCDRNMGCEGPRGCCS